MKNYVTKIILGTSVLAMMACTQYVEIKEAADYWQRRDTTSALYLRGPKAQHTLNHDIANCVVEVRELSRLGSIREATPPNTRAKRSDGANPNGYVAGFDTPERDGYNYASYYDYTDFEGCMMSKGWERTDFVKNEVQEEARINFIESIFDPEYRTKELQRQFPDDYLPEDEYQDLNQ